MALLYPPDLAVLLGYLQHLLSEARLLLVSFVEFEILMRGLYF